MIDSHDKGFTMARKLRLYPDKALMTPCQDVGDFGDSLKNLVEDLGTVLQKFYGLGLAAPQIGETLRVFVINQAVIRDEEGFDPLICVNPRIIEHSEAMEESNEGCLSLPGILLSVPRHQRVVMRALDMGGEIFDYEASGLLAAAIQHEVDHLGGTLILDRVSPLKRRMALKTYKKFHKNIKAIIDDA